METMTYTQFKEKVHNDVRVNGVLDFYHNEHGEYNTFVAVVQLRELSTDWGVFYYYPAINKFGFNQEVSLKDAYTTAQMIIF